ncbi:MAG TPA: glucosamine-6-phosphate deaminase [Lentisphaeria bacterium]|nr:glucosamine-6-phosphate deaminase [Lentisphaerota bacterium]HPY90379.1 glucosamine-6-phosphate deaminase [Lentisphaeria bacterium]HQL87708.1 glucosamine-6-phosphate deaminase [Lentisphaeria bacterium]
MHVKIFSDKVSLGKAAAATGAGYIRRALAAKGSANLVVATAASQFELQDALIAEPDIDWSKITIFHLDEYIGLPADHPAGFRYNLRKRLIDRLPSPPANFFPVDGNAPDLKKVIADLGKALKQHPLDLAFIGIGENGHIAFNDPPADFDAEDPFLVITLDEACRRQQLGEGWFPTLDAVPKRALTMSVPQIMSSAAIVNVVPDLRKAEAVKNALEGPLTNMCPASILMTHPDCHTFLDDASASLLKRKP